jgi:hypothetical protein
MAKVGVEYLEKGCIAANYYYYNLNLNVITREKLILSSIVNRQNTYCPNITAAT